MAELKAAEAVGDLNFSLEPELCAAHRKLFNVKLGIAIAKSRHLLGGPVRADPEKGLLAPKRIANEIHVIAETAYVRNVTRERHDTFDRTVCRDRRDCSCTAYCVPRHHHQTVRIGVKEHGHFFFQ